MEFDDAKENIQPLAAGRNASILQAALQAESPQELQQQRRQYENAIQNYDGDDPLEPWFEYIYWIEQSYPSGGKESGLEEVLLKCLTMFEKDEKYHQDRRMIKLYIKYIDTHENPRECYQQLYNQGIGTMVADLYICWAYYYDLSGNFRKADQIFRMGIECRAQPLEELKEAHQHFGFTMSQRILYDDDNSKKLYQSSLQEKRHALTSLKSHKKKVGSIRTGSAMKSHAPGKVQLNSANANTSSRSSGNVNLQVFEDENQDPNAIALTEPAPDTSKSVVKTILDSARKQENVKEPGPWNKAHDKKKGKLFASEPRTDLGFEILEDEDNLPIVRGKINYGKPFAMFDGFVSRNKRQEEWNLPVTLENELVPRSYPAYDKCLLYPTPNSEYSPEELRGYLWFKKRNIENTFTQRYGMVWKNGVDAGKRMYPNFVRKNQLIQEEPLSESFDPFEKVASGNSRLVFDPKIFYPSEGGEELQFEEVMYLRWKNGERKLKYGGNETIAFTEEMEETVCLPSGANRRKSFFPVNRKSIAPSQFSKLPTSLEDSEEDEMVAPTTPAPRRSVIMMTPKKPDLQLQTVCANDASDEAFEFKAPAAPPMKQQKLNFQIYEEEESNYEGNETCSTQVFNCFLKAQSASTPNPPNKTTKMPLVDKQPTVLNFSGIENVPVPAHSISTPVFGLPEDIDVGLTLQGKHLSTIMETSEQLTGNTASTKSSLGSPDNEIEGQQSRIPLINNACTLETVEEAGSLAEKNSAEIQLMKSLRLEDDLPVLRQHAEISRLEKKEDTVPTVPTIQIFEDKTETIPKMLFTKAGNFSRLEEKEDTVPFAKSVKFCEEKTETITKMILAPKTVGHLPPEDEMLDFFAKSPEKQIRSPINTKNVQNSQHAQAEKSILTASAFMNFNDSPITKQKCNYDSPELKAKLSLLKKPSNLSFLPNFDDAMECDDEKNKVCTVNELSASHSTKTQSYPNEQQKQTCGAGAIKKPKSTEDSFMSGFPSVTVGTNKPLEDSFMSYLSSASGSVSKQAVEDSFMKKFNTGSGNARKALDNSRQVGPSAVNAADNSSLNLDLAGKSFKMFEISFLPQSTATVEQNEDSFLPNMSAVGAKQDQSGPLLSLKRSYKVGDNSLALNVSKNVAAPKISHLGNSFMPNMSSDSSILHQKSKLVTGDIDTPESIRPANESLVSSFSMQMENSIKSTKVPFLGSKNDASMVKSQKTTSPQHQKPSKIPHFQQKFELNTSQPQPNSTLSFLNSFSMTESKKLPNAVTNLSSQNIETPRESKNQQKSESQPNSTLSLLNSFSMTESKKIPATEPKFLGSQIAEPTNEPQKMPNEFTIFEDSSCPDKANRISLLKNASSQKAPSPVTGSIKQSDQQQQFTIFEDSNCQRMTSGIRSGPEKGPQFNIFEDSTCKRPSSFSEGKATEIATPSDRMSTSVQQTNKSVCFDASIRVDDFFEDNIRTEAFAPNLSMIKNSTWLPNHNPHQSQIKEQSLHIKEEGDFSNTPHTSRGLSIFSTVPQEKSVDLMPPPPLPVASFKPSKVKIVSSPPQAPIEIDESCDDDEGSADQSIYYKKTPKTPGVSRHAWVPDADEQTPELNAFIHRQVCLETTQQAIDEYCVSEDVNPFNRDLIEAFLLQIEFTNYTEKLETCDMVRRVRPLKKDTTICINGKNFNILKLIAEGGYGAVYSGTDTQSGKAYAFKQERPANLWEYYICLELHSRLHNTEILAGFMNIEYALIGNNASILVSQLSRYGSLIAVCNKIKKETRKNVDEYVVMHMTSQLLLVMDHLHASNIIHADIKADNFLLMEKLVPGRKQPTIQLIDFGTSIDMDLFNKGQTFTYTHETESFKCPEMHEKRPWTYQLDLFGLAGVIHVLLFGKYMEIYKKPSGWSHKTHVPRYFNKSLWETIFHSLLNVHDCHTMPNLQNLRACLEEEIAEKDKVVCQKISEFNRALDL